MTKFSLIPVLAKSSNTASFFFFICTLVRGEGREGKESGLDIIT